MIKYFVWVKNQYGLPEAQIWFDKQRDGNGKIKDYLDIHTMTEEDAKIGIRELAEKYPYEAKS